MAVFSVDLSSTPCTMASASHTIGETTHVTFRKVAEQAVSTESSRGSSVAGGVRPTVGSVPIPSTMERTSP